MPSQQFKAVCVQTKAQRRKLQIQCTIEGSRKSDKHWHHYNNEHYDDGAVAKLIVWKIRVATAAKSSLINGLVLLITVLFHSEYLEHSPIKCS